MEASETVRRESRIAPKKGKESGYELEPRHEPPQLPAGERGGDVYKRQAKRVSRLPALNTTSSAHVSLKRLARAVASATTGVAIAQASA